MFGALYIATCQRGVGWQDSGTFQWRIFHARYLWDLHGEGLATFHSLYILIGQLAKAIPIGSFPFRVNALSGVGMATTLATLACTLRRETGNVFLSVLTVSAVGVSHAVWFLSTIAEVYTWSTALFSVELWLLVRLWDTPRRRDLLLLFGVNGLGLSIHNFALLPLPIYMGATLTMWHRGDISLTDLGWGATAYLVGAAPFLTLIGWATPKLGGLAPAVRSALVGRWGGAVFNASFDWSLAYVNYAIGALSFANALPVLAVVGLTSLYRRRPALAASFGGIAALHTIFVVRYSVPDAFTFLLPTLVSMTLLAGFGAEALLHRLEKWKIFVPMSLVASIVLVPIAYGVAPAILNTQDVNIERARSLPYRNEARYWLVPWKHNERSAQRFTQNALAQARPDDLILTDSTPHDPLLLAKELWMPSAGPRISHYAEASPSQVHAARRRGSVYVVSPVRGYMAPWLLDMGSFKPSGVLYRLTAFSYPQ